MTDETLLPVDPSSSIGEQPYYADEFFVQEDDPGIPHTIEARGRHLTVWIVRTLDLAAMKTAQEAAVRTHKDLKNNRVVVDSIDEEKFLFSVLIKLIKSWPFTDRATGAPTPVTLETLSHLDGLILAQLTKIANEYVSGRQVEIDFFENTSDAPSSVTDPTDPPSPLAPSALESPPTSVSTGDPPTSGA